MFNIKVVGRSDLPTATFYKLEAGVVYIRYKPFEGEFDLNDAKRHTKALESLVGSQGQHIILDFRGVNPAFSNEAREHFAKGQVHSPLRKSQAIVIDGLAQKIVANFYMKFNKPDCPVEIFNNPEDALKWSIAQD